MEKSVDIVIPTKNRYDTLALTIWGIINQTYEGWDLIIIDDSDVPIDMREHHLLGQLLQMILDRGHQYRVIFGEKRGPQICHNLGLQVSDKKYIWRIDDDEVPEKDTLKRLVNQMANGIGAVAPLVLLPQSQEIKSIPWYAGKIGWHDYCIQNYRQPENILQVEHLHSSFLYNREYANEIEGFYQGFSRVGHREETDFSYRLFRKGYKLLVDTGAKVTHFRLPSGGIRSNNPNQELWEADDRLFSERLKNLNPDKIFVPMIAGIGDVICASPMLRALKEKNPDKEIIVGSEIPNLLPYRHWHHDIVKSLTSKSHSPYYLGRQGRHLTDLWCDLYGVKNDKKLEIVISSKVEEEAKKIIDGKLTVLFFTQSKLPYKSWDKERWLEIRKYLEEKGYKVFEFPPILFNIQTTIALIKHSDFFISVDSFAGHAGNAVGKQGIVLWGETDPKNYGYDTNINIEKADHDQSLQWSINTNLTNEKMLKITVEDVKSAIDKIINNNKL